LKIGLIAAFSVLLAGAGIAVHPEGLSGHAEADEVAKPIGYSLPETATAADFQPCENCPVFVRVPDTPSELREIQYVAKYELTWSDYLKSVDDGVCTFPGQQELAAAGFSEIPESLRMHWTITRLTLGQVDCFKDWLSSKSDLNFDVPTHDEWKWFARAGVSTKYPWGDEPDASKASVNGTVAAVPGHKIYPNSYRLYPPEVKGIDPICGPVGQFSSNSWGLHDIVGLHQELTSTTIDRYEYHRSRGLEIPQWKGQAGRFLAGGSCFDRASDANFDEVSMSPIEKDGGLVGRFGVRFVAYRVEAN
jgi:formylglycine-generating enzyme required for sulfatase activity